MIITYEKTLKKYMKEQLNTLMYVQTCKTIKLN